MTVFEMIFAIIVGISAISSLWNGWRNGGIYMVLFLILTGVSFVAALWGAGWCTDHLPLFFANFISGLMPDWAGRSGQWLLTVNEICWFLLLYWILLGFRSGICHQFRAHRHGFFSTLNRLAGVALQAVVTYFNLILLCMVLSLNIFGSASLVNHTWLRYISDLWLPLPGMQLDVSSLQKQPLNPPELEALFAGETEDL